MAGLARRLRRRQQRGGMPSSETFHGPLQQLSSSGSQPTPTPKIPPKSGGRRYQIRRSGNLVVVSTVWTEEGWALADEDQVLSNRIATEIEKACRWFHVRPVPSYSCPSEFDTTPDEDVLERIARFDTGENRREAKRTGMKRFPLEQLPHDRKRALIGNIERIKSEWGFKWVDD